MPMKAILIKSVIAIVSLSFSLPAFSQCNIQHRLYSDGSMLYFFEPVNFYWTSTKELKGGVVTDKENYYIALQPSPFPEKPLGNKLKDDLVLKLSNDSVYLLEHFDTKYLEHDSVMQMLYLIDRKALKDFYTFEAISVKINMGGTEGDRTYVFKLHKSAIREQLNCFLDEDGKKKKK
jgi:hypothetical protein